MSLLVRMLGGMFGRRAAAKRPPAARTAPPAPDTAARFDSWKGLVLDACAAGRVKAAAGALLKDTPVPESPQQALAAVREVARPLLDACDAAGDAHTALDMEHWIYHRFVKKFEQASHYEACLRELEPPLASLGRKARTAPRPPPARRQRLLFQLHNMSYQAAHVELLCDLLSARLLAQPAEAAEIAVIGLAKGGVAPALLDLQRNFGIRLLVEKDDETPAGLMNAVAAQFDSDAFDHAVFVAPPPGLSYACARFGPERVGWLSMKFELGAFAELRHRYSFASGVRAARSVAGTTWLAAPPLMREAPPLQPSPGGPPPAVLAARRCGTVLYTVNREEKIADADYLAAVCSLLERFPQCSFVWTGRTEPASVRAFFERRGLASRQFFAGWVNPDDLLAHGDIFLDTPHLSGTVAARAMLLGQAVVSWSRSQSWINFFSTAMARDAASGANAAMLEAVAVSTARGLPLECDGPAAFEAVAARLVGDEDERRNYGALLRDVAHAYFLDGRSAAEAHFANFRGEPF
jgi:hypothetical protein